MKQYLSLIKFSHTVFALPFALVGFSLAVLHNEGNALNQPGFLLLKVIGCMVFARSAAMAFNRYLDRDVDALNPRTKIREIPSGQISPQNALRFTLISSLLFVACAWTINTICFFLSPVALTVILGYSFTKRFTPLCHLVLGCGLALAPVGAWLAVTGKFDWVPVIYGLVVLCWVSGFDVIYALQDEAFDRNHQLHSIPAAVGQKNALRIAQALHLLSALFLSVNYVGVSRLYPQMHWMFTTANLFFLGMLAYQHSVVKGGDLSRVNLAFFTTNGIASIVFGVLTIVDLFM